MPKLFSTHIHTHTHHRTPPTKDSLLPLAGRTRTRVEDSSLSLHSGWGPPSLGGSQPLRRCPQASQKPIDLLKSHGPLSHIGPLSHNGKTYSHSLSCFSKSGNLFFMISRLESKGWASISESNSVKHYFSAWESFPLSTMLFGNSDIFSACHRPNRSAMSWEFNYSCTSYKLPGL